MKKKILLASSLLLGITVNAQFTESNAPKIGDDITLYVIDSLAPNLSSTTGQNATWDYSSYSGYNNVTSELKVTDASTTPDASSFPVSNEALDMEGFLLSYTTNSASGRESQGIVYTEPTLGKVVATFTGDPEKLYSYPFDFGSPEITDNFAGDVKYTVSGLPQSSPLTGKVYAKVDGKGTLKLAANSYSNVLRYKLIDTMSISTMLGDMEMVRTQYEYYDHAQNNLPIFIHANIKFGLKGDTPMSESSVVLSLEDPITFVGISSNKLDQTAIYPNPAGEKLNIQLPSSINSAALVITDALGKQVYSTSINSTIKTIDVSSLNKGIYFVKISDNNNTSVKSVVIK